MTTADSSYTDAVDIEALAATVHQAYLDTCHRLGWPVKPENQVTYSELSEDSKELDRASVRAVLHALTAAGWRPPASAPVARAARDHLCCCGTTRPRDKATDRQAVASSPQFAPLADAAGSITPADLRAAAVDMLTTAGIDEPAAGDLVDRLLRILRGTIAPVITRHMLPCPRHVTPAWDRCPQCAWNTALLRASQVAHGNDVRPLQAWPERKDNRL